LNDSHPATRGERVDEMIRQAEAVLAELPPAESRRRLLQMAILRRDEVLLDGVLRALGRHAPEAPSRRRFTSHSRLKV
jgi:hypothetical protein